ncbi:MAG TPA: GxxExxY protein [Rhizomicrobium sp.]|jgi:GxxExxY protein|nr:GxxExxY protein [Rhizomicrobium sp.]
MTENEIGSVIVAAAMKVHSALGPGLLESAYAACLAHEIRKAGLSARQEVMQPIHYDGLELDNGYRLDLLVEECVVVELKAIDAVLPVHRAQLLSYMRLGDYKLGYLLNFHVAHMRDGIARLVNGL